MKPQNYKNHIRFFPAHHFLYYPLLIILFIISIYFTFTSESKLIWLFISLIFIFLFCIGFLLRQHYALTLQNRIIKNELRHRYFMLTGNSFEQIEYKYTEDQLFALRFASDAEFIPLLKKTLKENLDSDEIKKQIINWKGDYDRV